MEYTMRPIGDPQVGQVFQFGWDLVKHPDCEIKAMQNGPAWLSVMLPFGQPPVQFPLSQFPKDVWVNLQDQSGQQIPLSVLADYGGRLLGKWLPATLG